MRASVNPVVMATDQPLKSGATGFSASSSHARMLNDSWRTQLMVKAVGSSVRPGDVVLDIGTGTGILAMAAARAGARRVFALERGEMADAARAVVEANGFSGQIEVIHARSSRIKLAEKADLVVGEILGNDPLGEGITGAYLDASRRLTRPDARYLPYHIDLWLCPIFIPAPIVNAWSFTASNVAGWGRSYGFDFSALLGFVPVGGEYRLASPAVVDIFQAAGPKLKLLSGRPQELTGTLDTSIRAEVGPGCRMNGLLLGWTAHLAPGLKMDVYPPLPDSCHWHLPVWVLPQMVDGPATLQIHWSFSGQSRFSVEVL